MTAVNETSTPAPDESQDAPTRRAVARRRSAGTVAAAAAKPAARTSSLRKNVRSASILVAIAGLVAAVGLPAVAAVTGSGIAGGGAVTLQQEAAKGAQTLVVASDSNGGTIERDSYEATTPEEIEQKKAEEAALERAKAAKAAADAAAAALGAKTAAVSTDGEAQTFAPDPNLKSAGTGEVRWVLGALDYVGDGFLSRGGAHMGVDLLAPAMTPIFAAAAGTVTISSESHWGYGVAVGINSNVGGQSIDTLYGHMTYGTRQVEVGQSVEAGQLIGFVGSTGSSTANHLHFEVSVNGSRVDPYAWITANMS